MRRADSTLRLNSRKTNMWQGWLGCNQRGLSKTEESLSLIYQAASGFFSLGLRLARGERETSPSLSMK